MTAPSTVVVPSGQTDAEKEALALITKKQQEDLKLQQEVLGDMMKKYQDPGYHVDCILYNDGAKWRACIDIDQFGNLISKHTFDNNE